jgi:YVTN family beta-propeller protein
VVDTIPVGLGPIGIDITSDGLFLYTTDSVSGTVTVIRTTDNSVIQTIKVGDSPSSSGTFITPSEPCFAPQVPTLSEWGMIALVTFFGIAGFIAIRRKLALQS